MSQFDDLLKKIAEEHHKEISQIHIAHASEVSRLRVLVEKYSSPHFGNAKQQQSGAWGDVVKVLNKVFPDWKNRASTGAACAVTAIEEMAEQIKILKAFVETQQKMFGESAKENDIIACRLHKPEQQPQASYIPAK